MKNKKNQIFKMRLSETEKNDLTRLSYNLNMPISTIVRQIMFRKGQIKKSIITELKKDNLQY